MIHFLMNLKNKLYQSFILIFAHIIHQQLHNISILLKQFNSTFGYCNRYNIPSISLVIDSYLVT